MAKIKYQDCLKVMLVAIGISGMCAQATYAQQAVYGWADQAPGSTRFGAPRGSPVLVQDTFPNGQHPAVRFNGNSGFALDQTAQMQLNTLSIFVVALVNNGNTGEGIITCYNDTSAGPSNGGWALGVSDNSPGVVKWFCYNPNADTAYSAGPLGNNTPTLVTATFDANSGIKNLYVDSTNVATETGESPIQYSGEEVLALGYLSPFRQQLLGDVAEVIAYNSVDDTQRSNVEAYLYSRYFTSGPVISPPTNDMVLWYKADAGIKLQPLPPVTSWVNQASGGLHNGTPVGTPPTLAQAAFPNGQHPVVRFNGTGAFNLDTPDLELQDLSAYIVGKFDAGFTASQDYLGDGSDSSGGGWSVGVFDNGPNQIKFYTFNTGNGSSFFPNYIVDGDPIYITATFDFDDGGIKNLYFDSANVKSETGLGPIPYDPNTVGLGVGMYQGSPGNYSQYMYGDIAEMLLYSSVDPLQQSNVEAYFSAKYFTTNNPVVLPGTNNLVLWLRADAGVTISPGYAPQQLSILNISGAVELAWRTNVPPGAILQASANLVNWANITSNVVQTGGTNTVTVAPATSKEFYRLLQSGD